MEIKLPADYGFDSHDVNVVGSSSSSIESPFALTAEKFLKFAEEDIRGYNEKDLVNAVSNVKRAIENRVDLLHYAFGSHDLSEFSYQIR